VGSGDEAVGPLRSQRESHEFFFGDWDWGFEDFWQWIGEDLNDIHNWMKNMDFG